MTAMLRAVTLAEPFGPASCSLPEGEKESSHTAKPATGYWGPMCGFRSGLLL